MLYIASDHAGFEMKEKVKKYLIKKNIEFEDCGTNSAESCDYPIYAKALCEKIKKGDKGILICGSGIGMSMVANKFEYIRAGLCVNKKQAEMCRRHNNANVLVLQGRNQCSCLNFKIVSTFLNTAFDGGRHERRIALFSCEEPGK